MKMSFAARSFKFHCSKCFRISVRCRDGQYSFFFFFCLSTWGLFEARNARNEFVAPYTSEDDQKLQDLVGDFLEYFSELTPHVKFQQNPKYLKMQLRLPSSSRFRTNQSNPLLDALIVIKGTRLKIVQQVGVPSSQDISVMLANGTPYSLTDHLNQDPFEQY